MTWGESISDHATFILQKIDSLNLKYAYPEQILALRQPMPVAGTSDLIGVKEDGRVIIVDYKTGNKSPIKEEMQVNFYAKMLEINTYQDDKEAGTIADELITINSREKEVYKYQ